MWASFNGNQYRNALPGDAKTIVPESFCPPCRNDVIENGNLLSEIDVDSVGSESQLLTKILSAYYESCISLKLRIFEDRAFGEPRGADPNANRVNPVLPPTGGGG